MCIKVKTALPPCVNIPFPYLHEMITECSQYRETKVYIWWKECFLICYPILCSHHFPDCLSIHTGSKLKQNIVSHTNVITLLCILFYLDHYSTLHSFNSFMLWNCNVGFYYLLFFYIRAWHLTLPILCLFSLLVLKKHCCRFHWQTKPTIFSVLLYLSFPDFCKVCWWIDDTWFLFTAAILVCP